MYLLFIAFSSDFITRASMPGISLHEKKNFTKFEKCQYLPAPVLFKDQNVKRIFFLPSHVSKPPSYEEKNIQIINMKPYNIYDKT
jgi:hypothetical protein